MPRRLLLVALAAALVAGVAFETTTDDADLAAGERTEASERLTRTPGRRPLVPPALLQEAADGAATEPVPAAVEPAPGPPAGSTSAPNVDLAVVPVAADDPAGLAEQIRTAEQAIRSADPTPVELAYHGHLQQVAYRALADRPDWDGAVAQALPEGLRPIMAANVAAGRELAQPHARPQTKLPAWRIVEPAPAAELRAYYEEGEAVYGVPWEYLAAVNLTETRMGRIRGLSSAGAQGPMQFIPSTWASYGQGDINDPHDAILSAARYLAANGGGSGNLPNALYRYNPVSWYVNAVTAYAEQMVADERAYLGYHAWQVYYATSLGDVLLPVGYESAERRPVTPADVG
ncbi:MAG: lytic transglycosylase domain-containing protein [Actinomycetota bacterium]|nr:lytic transglycosylase domain-containing protein [Actinomycetota bacterium]